MALIGVAILAALPDVGTSRAPAAAQAVRWTAPTAYRGAVGYVSEDARWSAQVRYVLDEYERGARIRTYYNLHYHLAPGWAITAQRVPWVPDGCFAQPSPVNLMLVGGEGSLLIEQGQVLSYRTYVIQAPRTGQDVPVTITCPGSDPPTYADSVWVDGGFVDGGGNLPGTPDGLPPRTLRGELNGTYWELVAEGGSTTRCPRKNVPRGKGYEQLTNAMQAAVVRLYANLDAVGACYQFVVGARSKSYQQDLYDRWHKLADKRTGDDRSLNEICHDIRYGAKIDGKKIKGGLAQLPTGVAWVDPDTKTTCKGRIEYLKDGRTASGGPCNPAGARCRHVEGAAADISVQFPPNYKENLTRYQKAAAAAGLCGPDKNDPPHVELPYQRADKHHKGKSLFRCHFPEGPAPK